MEPALSSHPKPLALRTLVIHLRAAKSGTLPSACNTAIHAQVLSWFRQGDPKISQSIHESRDSPFCLSGLMSERSQVKAKVGDEFYLRLGLLNGNLLKPLLVGLEKVENEQFCLAEFPFALRSVNVIPGTDPWVAASDYSLLTKTSCIFKNLTLRFLSPTSFKLNAGGGIQQFPLPEAVFGNLYRRWNVFAPEELKFPKLQWSGLVSNYELKTETLRIKDLDERGAVGWVEYRFPDREQARIATILAHFACFAGVGRKTAMGMGQVIWDQKAY